MEYNILHLHFQFKTNNLASLETHHYLHLARKMDIDREWHTIKIYKMLVK